MKRAQTVSFFWKLIGEDEQVLLTCERKIQVHLLISGLLFFVFFLLSIVSFQYVFNGIFDISLLSWPLSMIWSLIIFNIYRLNLTTLSPHKLNGNFGYIISLLIRFIFMIFIGITIIKPLEVEIFKSFSIKELHEFRLEKISQNHNKISTYFDHQISELEDELRKVTLQLQENRISIDHNQLSVLQIKKNTLKLEKEKVLFETINSLKASNFFFNGLLLFNKEFAKIWFLTILLLLLFLLPLVLKFAIVTNRQYSIKTERLQRMIILEEYEDFKSRYLEIFKKNNTELIVWHENYNDPPFNTRRKKINEKLGNEKDFLNQLYGF